MHDTLTRIREKRRDDEGFTLIELLVVVVIIGVLVAIAVPVYLNYRQGAANKAAQSDIRGAISAIEQYYTENGNLYPGTAGATIVGTAGANMTFAAQTGGTAQTATVSAGTQMSYKNNTASYLLCATNSGGNKIYIYNSQNGGSVVPSTQVSVALCISTAS
jgi:type IV pilus assembly protein PilA